MCQKTSLQKEAYLKIKDMIMKAELLPGEKVSKKMLSEKTGVGDTPVREAIIRLKKEGLLQVIPQSGTYVSKINLEEVRQAKFARLILEKSVFESIIYKITPNQINELENNLKLQKVYLEINDHDKFFGLDEEFHAFFYTIDNKDFIWQWMKVINLSLNRFRYLRLKIKSLTWENILVEHQEFLSLVKEKKGEQLVQAVENHLDAVDYDIDSVISVFPNYFEV